MKMLKVNIITALNVVMHLLRTCAALKNCSHSLGASKGGYLPNTAFTASSQSAKFGPERGRLGSLKSAWIPLNFQGNLVLNEYLQVDLGAVKTVTAVSTQGLSDGQFFVKSFHLHFSSDGEIFNKFLHAKSVDQKFDGNTDSSSIVTRILPCSVTTRYVRFFPMTFAVGIALQVDILGCDSVLNTDERVKDFRVSNVTTYGLNLLWEQLKNDVRFFYLAYFPFEKNSQYPGPHYRIDPTQAVVPPIHYTRPISALASCTKYKFILRVYNTEGCGLPDVKTLIAATLPARPIKPQKFVGDGSTPESITLSWEKSSPGYQCADDITKFGIYYREQYERKYQVVELPPDVVTYKLANLKSWKRYVIQMASFSKLGQSDWAHAYVDVVGKPPENPPVIEYVESNIPKTIQVKWKNPSELSGDITGNSIHYRLKSIDGGEENAWIQIGLTTTTQSQTSVVIPDLLSWKEYEVFVMLFNFKYNISSSIETVLVKGGAPGLAPQNLTAANVLTSSSIGLKWNAVAPEYLPSNFQGYQTFYAEGEEKFINTHNSTTRDTHRVIHGLKADTQYSFKVAAVANSLLGPYSEILKVSTASGPLPSPAIIVLSSRIPNSFYIKWNVTSDIVAPNFLLYYKQKHQIDTWVKIDLFDATNYTLSQLLPWQQYDVKIIMVNLGRSSESVLRSVFVVGSVPGKSPPGLKQIGMGYTNIQIGWEAIDAKFVYGTLLGYVVSYEIDGDTNSMQTNFTTDKNTTIEQLKPNTTYKVKVAGKTQGGVGVYSSALLVSTKRVQVPEAPIIQTVENTSPWKIRLNFIINGANLEDVDILKIQFLDGKGRTTITEVPVSSPSGRFETNSVTVSVHAFRKYQISMKACILKICSAFSLSKNIITAEDVPSAVKELVVRETADYVKISWLRPDSVPGILRHYVINVEYSAISSSVNNYPKTVNNETLTYILDDLPPFTNLKVEVKAVTISEGTGVSQSFKSPEGKPGAPTDVKVATLKDTKMFSVKWDEPDYPNGIVTKYKITYSGYKLYDLTFKDGGTVEVNETDEKIVRILKLKPGTTYKVNVYAKTSKGYGSPSPDILFNTKVQAPIEPSPPVSYPSEVTSYSISVKLKPARQENGQINYYDVIIEILEPDSGNDVENRRRRATSYLPERIHGYKTAMELGEKFYIAAKVDGEQLQSYAKFVIGNGITYNGFKNVRLQPESSYKLHVRAVSEYGGKTLYGPAASLMLPRTDKEKTDRNSFPISTPIGICAGFALIVIVSVIVVLLVRSSNRKKRDRMDPYELGLIEIRAPSETVPDRPVSLTGDYPTHPDHPPIPVAAFPKQVAKLHKSDNNGFKAEYNQLEIGKEFSWDIAHLPENKPKNRYANIVAYDHSRVVLSTIEGIPGSDYINASYIDGYKKPNAYISTQGPLPATFNDFWRMVWEVRSYSIVMLTNLQEKNKLKCHKYWPDDCIQYGDIVVTLVRSEQFADYAIRTFKLEKVVHQKNFSNEVRDVKQFHFTGWPDHGVPLYPTTILNFQRKVRLYQTPEEGPSIVHCSAGVGRTGAYIVIDNMLDRSRHHMDVDVFNTIAVMRTRRIAMVQTQDQYIFVHDAIVESVLTGDTQIPVHELRAMVRKLDQIEPDSKVSGFEKQWKTLNHASPILPKSDFLAALQVENIHKNRYSTALPSDVNRVLLLPMDDKESTTYINAVYVDSFKQRNAFILTQSPLPKTVIDFWRMVCEHGTTSIVMLNAVDEGDDYAKFWPDSGVRDYEMISVEVLPTSKKDDMNRNTSLKPIYRTPPTELVVRNFQVTDTRNPKKSYKVKLFQYVGWTETRVPNTYKAVISLLTQVERWQQQSGNGPITIMCSDGIGRSGTLATIIYVVERAKIDQVVDPFQAIKKMRIQRPHVVKYMDQYQYIHLAVQEYLSAFDEYTKL